MSKNRFELDEERLATTDEHGDRVYLHPEDVKGPWKDRRTIVYWFLIGIYLILPWIYIKNKPALMINIFKREFTLMGFTFYGVDPILFFLIAIFLLFFIAFMTSLFGRVWCGWACPQTVFIQSIFLKVESFIEGSARKRRELENAPMSLSKFIKKFSKWTIFTIISLHIAHTFIGYFVGPRELLAITMGSPLDNFGIFTATMIISSIFLLDFGWFREQFCIIACPYGRMQSVMMDENSLVVAYDLARGEPRRGSPDAKNTNEGDCINCYNCVKVCPTGIDIRRGSQLECIACTNCIDACDEIMIKVNKPKGLIRYASENEAQGLERKLITSRSIIYAIITIFIAVAFILFLKSSTDLTLIFLRSNEAYSLNEEQITNQFTVKFSHQGNEVNNVFLKIKDTNLSSLVTIITPVTPIKIKQHETKAIVFFKFDPIVLKAGSKRLEIDVIDHDTNKLITTEEVNLVGPAN